jgi:hypothetical protein
MREQTHRQPLIIDSWRGEENPLGAFSTEEEPQTLGAFSTEVEPPTLGAVSTETDLPLNDVSEPNESSRFVDASPPRRTMAIVLGLSALGVVGVATVALLSMFVRSTESLPADAGADTGSIATAAAPLVGSAARLSETDVNSRPAETNVNSLPVDALPPPELRVRNQGSTPQNELPRNSAVGASVESGPAAVIDSAKETRPEVARLVDAPPSLPPETPIGTFAIGEPAPIAIPAPITRAAPVVASAAPPPAASAANSRNAVTAVLQRYAAAFSSLDARAAKAVWPGVNEGALTRAFSSLQEQQFDLGDCQIWITGPSAVASCAGRASYTPRIGNKKPRSEAREWTFYLQQEGQQWSIGTVKTR